MLASEHTTSPHICSACTQRKPVQDALDASVQSSGYTP